MADNNALNALIDKLVNAESREEKLEAYRAWAHRYDEDLDLKGYIAPDISVSTLLKNLTDKNAVIYDAGCGTGKVGSLLKARGFNNVIGADFSAEMLQVAEASNSYQELQTADYTESIKLSDNSIDAVICVGVYSREFKHIFLKELTRIVKPDGVIVLSCRPVHFEGYADADIQTLEKAGSISLVSSHLDTYMTSDNSKAHYIALKVLN